MKRWVPVPGNRVRIHYHRPPDRTDVFEQWLVAASPDCLITFLPHTPLASPVRVGGEVVLEDGAPAVWFTFPGAWHDVGRFHRRDGTFTGIYANILTPVRMLSPLEWETIDLFLDLWQAPHGPLHLLDEDELRHAAEQGWLEPTLVARAHAEAERLWRRLRRSGWPAPILDWPLERVQTRTGTLGIRLV